MDFEQQIINAYLNGYSGNKISELFKIAPHKIYYILAKYNIPRRSNKINSRKYSLNQNYFHKIDSPQKAYWLGFIFADGTVGTYNNQSILKIDLHKKDINHLRQLSDDLESNKPILEYVNRTTYGTCPIARLTVTSQQIVSDLGVLGCLPRKTYNLGPPQHLDSLYQKDFIRGIVDGDGSISKDSNLQYGYKLKISGTYNLLNWIQTILPRYGNIYKDKTIFSYESHADNITWLYKNSDRSLERKYARYQLIQSIADTSSVLS